MQPIVATIGFFDGVHTGHRYLLQQLKTWAEEQDLPAVAITFDIHPLSVVRPNDAPQLLSTTKERTDAIKQLGIEVHLLPFTPTLASMSAEDFLRFLHKDLGVTGLLMGYNHHFGSDGRLLTSEDYISLGRVVGIDVRTEQPFEIEGISKVSSSTIRQQLTAGNVNQAIRSLGHPYTLEGIVVKGRQVGRTIGFPTANIEIDPKRLRPDLGIYACLTSVDNKLYKSVVNIGQRPTLNNGTDISIEAHLLDFVGDLYGKRLSLVFFQRIRSEMKFASLEELQQQIGKDVALCHKIVTLF